MIEINLLPEQMRRQKKDAIKFDMEGSRIKLFIAGGAIGFLVILIIFLSVACSIRRKQVLGLLASERAMSRQKTTAEKVNKEISALKTKMNTLSSISTRDFLWAEKLNMLSDMILPGIWFTRIQGELRDKLIIEGSVISKKEEAMATVGKFMKNIRQNSEFFEDFENIKLESVQRKTIEEKDIVDFRIALYFKNTD